MPRPGTWQWIRTNDGWHVRLVGANGEIVVWSEEYKNKADATRVVDLVLRSLEINPEFHPATEFHEIDQRTSEPEQLVTGHQASCRDCSWTVFHQDYAERANQVGRHRLTTGHRVAMTTKE